MSLLVRITSSPHFQVGKLQVVSVAGELNTLRSIAYYFVLKTLAIQRRPQQIQNVLASTLWRKEQQRPFDLETFGQIRHTTVRLIPEDIMTRQDHIYWGEALRSAMYYEGRIHQQ